MYGKYRIIVDEIAWARESSDAWGDVGCKYLQTNVEAVLRGDYVINEPVYVIQTANVFVDIVQGIIRLRQNFLAF